jgi:hypothetical protein
MVSFKGIAMNTTGFNLRGVRSEVMVALKQEAEKQNTSVNVLILKLIENGIGYSHTIKRPTHHDLDKLAGTWSVKDEKEFEKNMKDFGTIDEDLWS